MVQQSFNHGWRFFYGDPPRRHRAPLDDSEWQVISLPHDWSITLDRAASNPSTASGGFFTNGRGWYHQHLYAPMEWQDKKISLEFEGVYMNAEVWLNEHFLGRHPYGYTSFQIDLTPFLRLGEENLLRVLVDNSAQMNSRWYSGSGIYRSAWLWVRNLVHIQHYGVYITTPEVSAESALVHARTWVENETDSFQQVTLRSRIYDAAGNLVAETSTQQAIEAGKKMEFNQPIPVKTPMLWSPDTPVMYRLESDVFSAGALCDSLVTPFGIRSLHFSAEQGFLLNGQPLKLKGGCVHHDNGVLGSAAYPDSEARKVRLHKESGYNAIRCAHNPPSPAFLDACDQLGMLVIDEAFDCWKEGKNPFDYHVVFEDWWKRDIASMVCRDRNHPSVIIWSIGNEVMERDGRSEGQKIARMLADEVRTLDPTRPVTAAICGVWDTHRTWEDTDVVFAALDIGGYNYQWAKYETDHARHPLRMMMGTESFPCEAFENWESVLAHPYVIGDFVWTSMDYLGEAGIGRVYYEEEMKSFLGEYPWHQAYCGDIDLCGFKRPQSYYRDIVWGCGDPLYIAVHYPAPEGQTAKISRWGWFDVAQDWTWNGLEGKTMKVDVYSACESVELFVNGRSLGVQPAGKAHKYLATFDAPYQPGELSVVGMNGGKPVAARTVATVGAPTAIRLSADRTSLPAKDGALAYITVEVVDGQGRLNPKAGHLIRFSVTGEGLLLAVGNGNPVSTEKYVGSERSAFRGRCLAVVKASGTPGEVRIKAEADGLAGAELVLRCE